MGTALWRLLFPYLLTVSCAAPVLCSINPRAVQLDGGTFIGNVSGNTTSFLGIPFAEPPIGRLRFRLSVPNAPYKGTSNATQYGSACVQQNGTSLFPPNLSPEAITALGNVAGGVSLGPGSEDCLTVNVIKPTNTHSNAKLPVLVWIYGGGFTEGGSAANDGRAVVERSLVLGEPVLFASMNYRVSALGFIASKEVEVAGLVNLGLQDQRQALRWVQKYIHAFGGDPSKVTIWGESAGANSVSLQMLTNGGNTEGLFRAGFMESGAPPPLGPSSHGQVTYDALVAATGCSTSHDTLECLRGVPLSAIRAAQDASPSVLGFTALKLAWAPRVDNNFIPKPAQQLVSEGSVARVPFISGNCDDEGTLFSLSSTNLTTDAEVFDYIHEMYFPQVSNGNISNLLQLYPSDPSVGSPYDTGTANALSAQFKRIASLQGDMVFQAPRRFFLHQRSDKQPTYSFLSKRMKDVPDLGAFHGTDLLNIFGPGDMTDYLIRFAATLDPNGNTGTFWPRYTDQSPELLTFLDGATPLTTTEDTYRVPEMEFMTALSLADPI
ncbi:Alpha/Beta hydrolase protein [Gloeopeniophorella convolvens]|nr:Alpha/Beta hydrolase protein [Gloeopeniophorella convolvens]